MRESSVRTRSGQRAGAVAAGSLRRFLRGRAPTQGHATLVLGFRSRFPTAQTERSEVAEPQFGGQFGETNMPHHDLRESRSDSRCRFPRLTLESGFRRSNANVKLRGAEDGRRPSGASRQSSTYCWTFPRSWHGNQATFPTGAVWSGYCTSERERAPTTRVELGWPGACDMRTSNFAQE